MRIKLLHCSFGALLAVGSFAPASADAQKLYRWVDQDGKVHYSDSLPAEEIDRARRELSLKTGSATGEVERALTAEQRAQAETANAQAASEAKRAEDARQSDSAMLAWYPTEQDLQHAFDERRALLEETLKATRIGIDSQRASFNALLVHAADQELAGRPVDAKTADSLKLLRGQIDGALEVQRRRESERAALDLEYQDTVARYRRLRDAAAAQLAAPAQG